MGTTINGVYKGGKQMRRVRALARLEKGLKQVEAENGYAFATLEKVKAGSPDYHVAHTVFENTSISIKRMAKEIKTLKERI